MVKILTVWPRLYENMTMTPRRRPNGQKIVVILPAPSLQLDSCLLRDDSLKFKQNAYFTINLLKIFSLKRATLTFTALQ